MNTWGSAGLPKGTREHEQGQGEGEVIQENTVRRDLKAEVRRAREPCVVSADGVSHPNPGMEGGAHVGSRAGTHLGASIHKEDRGVLLPWLHGVWLVDHAVEAYVCPRVEVKDFRGHIIRGTACRDSGHLSGSPQAADTPLPGPQPQRVARRHPILYFLSLNQNLRAGSDCSLWVSAGQATAWLEPAPAAPCWLSTHGGDNSPGICLTAIFMVCISLIFLVTFVFAKQYWCSNDAGEEKFRLR